MGAGAFIKELGHRVRITPLEAEVIEASGVRSYAALYNLLTAFPSVRATGINVAKLSAAAAQELPALAAALTAQANEPLLFAEQSMGARHPPGAPGPVGYVVPMPGAAAAAFTLGATAPSPTPPPAGGAATSAPVNGGAISVLSGSWPVKDQGDRGTCVAFAVNACSEFIGGATAQLSEQFLYWATKTQVGDPAPTLDGTHLRFASVALSTLGVCSETLWPYAPQANLANVTYQVTRVAPSSGAVTDALLNRRQTTIPVIAQGTAAQALWDALNATKAPVAISLPVFQSPAGGANNWNSPLAVLTGEVPDPFVTGLCIGGHAVCVTGFSPSATDPMGGYFIIRNSWGRRWGTTLPQATCHGPDVGYGQVSASYVNDYLWEMCHS